MTTYLKFPFLTFLFVLFLSSFLFAQTGTIEGFVFDSKTNEALPGANIYLDGTSYGAATDLNGKYIIPNVNAGDYHLVAKYIGYQDKTIDITVEAGKTIQQVITLDFQSLEGETIEVTGQAEGQLKAINNQLSSNTIKNVVAAEKIHELPDASAATALSRLPGVSLMNGDQVVIRGVQAKLNQVLLNGVQLPSTDMNNRSTNLGFISSNLLSGIEVIKAITPDMDANALGGVVNLQLREAPTGLHYDALTQGNYNATDRVSDNYTFWASVSNRFLDDKLGIFVQANMDRSDGGDQRASISPALLKEGNTAIGEATYKIEGARFEYNANIVKNNGGSLILDYRLPKGKIVLQNTYAGNVTDKLDNYINFDFVNTRVVYTPDRSLYGKDLWINALQTENTFGDIKVNVSLSHSFTQQYTHYGYSPGINGAAWSQFYDGGAVAPFGTDTSGTPIQYFEKEDQEALTLNKVLGVFDNLSPENAANAQIQGWTNSIARQFKQHLYNAAIDVSKPVNFSNNFTATFKAGGKYIRTTRENNIDELFAHTVNDLYASDAANKYLGVNTSNPVKFSNVMNNNFKRGQYYLNDLYDFTNGGFKYTLDRNRYDTWLKLSEKDWSVPIQYADSYKNDWNGAEQFSAAYLMGTFNIGPKLTLLGGGRFESYNMIYHAQFTMVQHTVFGNCISTEDGTIAVNDSLNPVNPLHKVPYNTFNVDRTDNNWFPNVQLKYDVNDWSDVRLAYTTGISRPDYTAIIPKVAFYKGNFELGNPKLKPSTAQSFDIVGSFHNNNIGLFTVNAFYKIIKNEMYKTKIYYINRDQYAANVYLPDSLFLSQRFEFDVSNSQTVEVNLNNPRNGYIRGVEIDWQTNFWYLPGLLSSLVLDINYTKSGSNTAYTVFTPTPLVTYVTDSITGRTKKVTTNFTDKAVYTGRLIQQANDVINVALGADYKGFHTRLSFSMTGNVINARNQRPEEDSFTGNIYRWDFTVKQELPVDGLSLTLSGVNIFHNGIKTYRKYRRTPDAPITKNLVAVLYSPSLFSMNLRYSF